MTEQPQQASKPHPGASLHEAFGSGGGEGPTASLRMFGSISKSMRDHLPLHTAALPLRRAPDVAPREHGKMYDLIPLAAEFAAWEWDLETGKLEFTGTVEEVLGGNYTTFDEWQQGVHPADRAMVEAALSAAIFRGEEYRAEFRYIWPDGSVHWVVGRGRILLGDSRKATHMLGINIEVSERKHTEQLLAEAKLAAEQASRAKSVFLANMSHEIRTPLGAIIGFAEFLMNSEVDEAERQEGIRSIARNGRHLAQLIDNILDISKVEAGRMQIERLQVDVFQLVRDVVESFRLTAKAKDLSLIWRSTGWVPTLIWTDPTRLRQVLTNVIGNAVKFTTRGSVAVEMTLEKDRGDGKPRLALVVTDTGCGISPEEHDVLFQPFSQADCSTTRKFGGSGLGLDLSRRLARMLGGDVVLTDSVPGGGSCFTITIDAGELEMKPPFELPEGRDGAGAFMNTTADKRAVSSPAKVQRLLGLRVLLAEDAPDNQFLITRLLSFEGATVEVASDGAEAVRKAQGGNFDLVLMDIQMPILDGYDATLSLRRDGYGKPIVALTAHAMKEERLRCLAVGCNEHLTKPIDLDKLVDTIRSYTHPEGAGSLHS